MVVSEALLLKLCTETVLLSSSEIWSQIRAMDHFSVKFARAHDREFTLAVCFSDSSMASSVVKVGT